MMDKRLTKLKEAEQRFDKKNEISRGKIQRVPMFLRQNAKFAHYYSPKMISFGPIHHGKENTKEAEQYKLLWTSKFVAEYSEKRCIQDPDRTGQDLLKKIENNIDELKKLFSQDVIEGYIDTDMAWMLFVDGCSLLHLMEKMDGNPESLSLKLDQLVYMSRDMLLLENQLPRRLLEMLSKEEGKDLECLFGNYTSLGEYKRLGIVVVSIQNPKPIHLLDYYRSTYLSPQVHLDAHTYEPREKRKILRKYNEADKYDNQIVPPISWHTCKNIQELKTVGIRVKANKLHKNNALAWSNITFTSKWFGGELRLPVFDFSDSTPYFLWNVMAYEMCPDVDYKYECCSYFSFMDSLIDTAEDVKELRLAGVFQNLLGSDQDLANLFNELGNDLPTKLYSNVFHSQSVAYSKKYIMIKHQIENHYKTKWRTWLALAYNTYCNTPWTMIAFLAAFLALVLTFIQTWFAIHSNN